MNVSNNFESKTIDQTVEVLTLSLKKVDVHQQNRSISLTQKNTNVFQEEGLIDQRAREINLKQKATTVWLTGLSGSGKSFIAKHLEKELYDEGRSVYRLDGDNIRLGLNKDLGFVHEDRSENIRRIAEMAKLFNDAGVIVIAAFISPYREDRLVARNIIGDDQFTEVYVDTPLEICEQRDPKGLYKKARSGEISEFTGISSPYQSPQNAEISIQGGLSVVTDSVKRIMKIIKPLVLAEEFSHKGDFRI